MSHEASLKNHPKELWILSITELCERFAFWGVGNLLVLFLIEYYQFPNAKATHIYGIFAGCSTFLPLVGGYLADRWNYQAPMLLGAIVNAIGCFMLATGEFHLLYPALFVIAMGYGIFTPSILTTLGYTYRNKSSLREAGFSIYYASINIGVFLAMLSLGSIATYYSWNLAFFVAGVVQLIGLCPLFFYFYRYKGTSKGLKQHQAAIRSEKKALTKGDKDRLVVIGIFFFFSIIFWTAYVQAYSSMSIFIHSFMNRMVGGIELPEGVFLSSESFFLILLAPVLAILYAKLQRKKMDPSPATKTGLSLLFLAACFSVMVLACLSIPANATSASVSSAPLIGAYFLMAVGEMLLAPIGLSMVSNLAPARFTAMLIGGWYLCVGLAYYLGGLLAGLMSNVGGLENFFSIFVVMTFFPGLLFLFFARRITKMSHREPVVERPNLPK
jgi:POT family proton-dependent oligopeptide transporter